MGTLVAHRVHEHVATLTIDRPEQHNALTWDALTELRDALAAVASDPDVRVVVLTGAGDRAFCSGVDLATMAADGHAEIHAARGALPEVFRALWSLGKPTIARVQGWCLAGGFGLALACDLVVAADDAIFATPEIDRGLWPMVITVPMVRSMPPKVALDLMMTGRRVDALEAQRLGFVSRVVAKADLDREVDALAATLASKPSATMRLGRDAFYAVWDQGADAALAHLHAMLTVVNGLDDAREGIAAFAEKRAPEWSGR